MRRSPNSHHHQPSLGQIPTANTSLVATCHPPNPIARKGPSPPPATKMSLSRRLPSVYVSSLAPYRWCLLLSSPTSSAFIALRRSPSLASFVVHHSLSSPFTSLPFIARRQLQLLRLPLNFASMSLPLHITSYSNPATIS